MTRSLTLMYVIFQQVWSNTLAADAARHISQCIYGHTNNNKYGENLYLSTSSSLSYAGVVRSWHSEKKDYNYYCNSCKAGKVCGHYTQVSYPITHAGEGTVRP